MSEYIDRSATVDALNKLCDRVCQYSKAQRKVMCGACPLGDAFTVIEDDLPAADVVEVVRCRECKWWVREGNDSYGYAMFCDHDCSLGGQGIKKPEDYCSYGERKGGNND